MTTRTASDRPASAPAPAAAPQYAGALPVNELPLIRDPDLAAAVEKELKGLSGARLERAQAAIRRVHASGVTGQFSELVDAYAKAIKAAIAD